MKFHLMAYAAQQKVLLHIILYKAVTHPLHAHRPREHMHSSSQSSNIAKVSNTLRLVHAASRKSGRLTG